MAADPLVLVQSQRATSEQRRVCLHAIATMPAFARPQEWGCNPADVAVLHALSQALLLDENPRVKYAPACPSFAAVLRLCSYLLESFRLASTPTATAMRVLKCCSRRDDARAAAGARRSLSSTACSSRVVPAPRTAAARAPRFRRCRCSCCDRCWPSSTAAHWR
jgi:hypothetical protein